MRSADVEKGSTSVENVVPASEIDKEVIRLLMVKIARENSNQSLLGMSS